MEIPITSTHLTYTELNTVTAQVGTKKKEKALDNLSFPTDDTPKGRALIKAGATRAVAYETMVNGLAAESMTVDKFGAEHMTPDHGSRLKAAELISRLNGDLKTTEVSIDNRVVYINVTPSDLELFIKVVSDIKDEIRGLRANGRQTGEVIDVNAE